MYLKPLLKRVIQLTHDGTYHAQHLDVPDAVGQVENAGQHLQLLVISLLFLLLLYVQPIHIQRYHQVD